MRFLIALVAFTPTAFAISDADLAATCLEKGKAKIAMQASAWGCEVNLENVKAIDVDNRWYNPSKYVWYQVPGMCNGFDGITKLVQYYRGNCI